MSTVVGKPEAQEIAACFGELETLPEVVTKAFSLMRDPKSSSYDLAKLINLDQGLTTRILAMANSACFGAMRRFVTAKEAIVRLGYKNIQTILYAASASSALSRPVSLYGLGRNELWKHSITCAICSRLIAIKHGHNNPDEVYVAGLLHDIGLPALDRFVRDKGETIRLIREAGSPVYLAEQQMLGFDHAYLGGILCRRWQLPEELIAAVSLHHAPLDGDQSTMKTAAIVHVADVVSLLPEVRTCSSSFATQADPRVLDWLGLAPKTIESLIPQVHAMLRESEGLVSQM